MLLTIDTTDVIKWNATGYERIADNVLNIIRTRRYEVPYMRAFGLSPDYYDRPFEQIKGVLISDIIDSIERYEPRATVQEVDLMGIDERGNLEMKVVIEV